MTAQTRSAPRAAVRDIWRRNADLLRNAGSLAATTGLTSVFGFVFWVIAAREFSPQAVGYGSAAISAMMLLGTVGMFGLGTVLIGELPRRRDRGGLIARGAHHVRPRIARPRVRLPDRRRGVRRSFPRDQRDRRTVAALRGRRGLTGVSLVFDEATIGLMRGGVQLSRNLVMSVGKLAVLPLRPSPLHDVFGVGLILAWVLGTTLSLAASALLLKRSGSRSSTARTGGCCAASPRW